MPVNEVNNDIFQGKSGVDLSMGFGVVGPRLGGCRRPERSPDWVCFLKYGLKGNFLVHFWGLLYPQTSFYCL